MDRFCNPVLEPSGILLCILYLLQPISESIGQSQMVQTNVPGLSERPESGDSFYLLIQTVGMRLIACLLFIISSRTPLLPQCDWYAETDLPKTIL